ncbi:MAG: hypothetical protein ACI89X_002987 [Planctomycetota bacterium]|jgi:hypothetical protein
MHDSNHPNPDHLIPNRMDKGLALANVLSLVDEREQLEDLRAVQVRYGRGTTMLSAASALLLLALGTGALLWLSS